MDATIFAFAVFELSGTAEAANRPPRPLTHPVSGRDGARLAFRHLEQFSLACSCSPTTLQRMAGGAVFRLNEPGNGPADEAGGWRGI